MVNNRWWQKLKPEEPVEPVPSEPVPSESVPSEPHTYYEGLIYFDRIKPDLSHHFGDEPPEVARRREQQISSWHQQIYSFAEIFEFYKFRPIRLRIRLRSRFYEFRFKFPPPTISHLDLYHRYHAICLILGA